MPVLPFLPPVGRNSLALAVPSDAIDGPLARRRGEVTGLGAWLDASVDTLGRASALVAAAPLELRRRRRFALGLLRALFLA